MNINELLEILPISLIITRQDHCMVCGDNNKKCKEINLERNFGLIYCPNCINEEQSEILLTYWKAVEGRTPTIMVNIENLSEEWYCTDIKEISLENFFLLLKKNSILYNWNVKRSNGEIQDGWSVRFPSYLNLFDDKLILTCYSLKRNLEKGCPIDELMEYNPEVFNIMKNLTYYVNNLVFEDDCVFYRKHRIQKNETLIQKVFNQLEIFNNGNNVLKREFEIYNASQTREAKERNH